METRYLFLLKELEPDIFNQARKLHYDGQSKEAYALIENRLKVFKTLCDKEPTPMTNPTAHIAL